MLWYTCQAVCKIYAALVTEAAIRQYYADSARVFNKPYEDYIAFIQNTMSDAYTASMTATATMEGQPPVNNSQTQTKQNLLEGAHDAYYAMQGGRVDYKINSIEISPEGGTATVDNESGVYNMKMSPPGAEKALMMDGTGSCKDHFVLGAQGNLQILTSSCDFKYNVKTQ